MEYNMFGKAWGWVNDYIILIWMNYPLKLIDAVGMRVETADKNITIIHTTPYLEIRQQGLDFVTGGSVIIGLLPHILNAWMMKMFYYKHAVFHS